MFGCSIGSSGEMTGGWTVGTLTDSAVGGSILGMPVTVVGLSNVGTMC